MTFTADQIALRDHIEAQNARFVEAVKAQGATAWCTTVSDPAHWAESGVFTIAQYERYSLIAEISDVSKEAQGFRARYDWEQYSLEELQAIADGFHADAERAYLREQEEARVAVQEFEDRVQEVIAIGAKDRTVALRWMTEGEDFWSMQDVEHWVYQQGMLFTDEGRALVKELEEIVSLQCEEVA